MITDLALEGIVEFGNFRKHTNTFKKSGYIKLANLFSYFSALKRHLVIVFIKYMVITGMFYMILTIFGTEQNPNTEFTRRPTVADLSLNLILDSVILNDVLLIW